MPTKLMVPLIVGALIIGGGSFYGGMQYAASKVAAAQSSRTAAGDFRSGRGGAGGLRNGGGFNGGEIVTKDATGLTLKLRDGGSKIVFFSASTTVNKMTPGSLDDLTSGTEITVNGPSNPDGSLTANMIQIRPAAPSQPPASS